MQDLYSIVLSHTPHNITTQVKVPIKGAKGLLDKHTRNWIPTTKLSLDKQSYAPPV